MQNRNDLIAKTALAISLATAVPTVPAAAYMGAGAGLSAIGSIISFLGVILLMLFGFVWYPVKRMLKRNRGGNEQVAGENIAAKDEEDGHEATAK